MATIAKISDGASSASALNYALGKGKAMHNDTERWLEEQQLVRPDELKDCRAVAVGGTNGVDPVIAKEQFKAVRQAFGQDKRRNQVLRIVQSFALNELDPTNTSDWQRANDLGCELAEKLYSQYQCAVYTQIDGKNHVIHNHINVNKVNLQTGKKLDERKGAAVERARKFNDEIAKKQGWKVIPPVREHKSKTEQDLTKKGQYSYMADLRSRIDAVMTDTAVSDFKTFSERLDQSGVHVSVRGKNISYMFLDVNSKQRRARGKRLGADYDKEAIDDELESRSRKQATYGREPKLTFDLQQSKNELEQSEKDQRIAQKDQHTADTQQSRINELIENLEHQVNKFKKRFGQFELKIKRFFKQDNADNTADSTAKTAEQTADANKKTELDNDVANLPAKQAQNQPTKPIELDKYGLNKDQRLMIDVGNKIIRERGHELGELQLGYDGLTLREREAEKNHEVAKPLKLTKGQIDTLVDANEEYSRTGLPRYKVFPHGLSYNYNLKFKKFQKKQKLAENQAVRAKQQSKEQTPTRRRRTSRRLEIKKNQNQKKNIDRGPKM